MNPVKFQLEKALTLNPVPRITEEAPLFVDVEIHILNNFVWHQIQQAKD